METNLEMIIMGLIVDSGSARSFAMEAIYHAKAGVFESAQGAIKECNEQLVKAHHAQTDLIQQEAGGNSGCI